MSFKVLTWNIENFAKQSEGNPNKHYAAKLDYVSEFLRAHDPDVAALQEVLDEEALTELAERTGRRAVAGLPDGRGNRVAFLVRSDAKVSSESLRTYELVPGTRVQELSGTGEPEDNTKMSRPPLTLTIEHEGKPITLLNAHLKSKLHTYPGGKFSTNDEDLRAGVAFFDLERRAAEAATLRARATELLKQKGARVVVLGDLNDGPHAATTEILYGPPGSQLEAPEDAQRESSGFTRGDLGDAQRLFNVAKLVPEAERWSRVTNNVPELIDHVLCSERLLPRKGKLRSVPKVEIVNADLRSVGEEPRKDSGIPDHAPVVAEFDV